MIYCYAKGPPQTASVRSQLHSPQKMGSVQLSETTKSYKLWDVRVLNFLLKFIITFLFFLHSNHCTMPFHHFGATPLPWPDWNWFRAWRHWNLLLGQDADEPARGAAGQVWRWSIYQSIYLVYLNSTMDSQDQNTNSVFVVPFIGNQTHQYFLEYYPSNEVQKNAV